MGGRYIQRTMDNPYLRIRVPIHEFLFLSQPEFDITKSDYEDPRSQAEAFSWHLSFPKKKFEEEEEEEESTYDDYSDFYDPDDDEDEEDDEPDELMEDEESMEDEQDDEPMDDAAYGN